MMTMESMATMLMMIIVVVVVVMLLLETRPPHCVVDVCVETD